MKAKAVKDIAKTKYDAQKDYYAQTGQAKLDGVSEYNQAGSVCSRSAAYGWSAWSPWWPCLCWC